MFLTLCRTLVCRIYDGIKDPPYGRFILHNFVVAPYDGRIKEIPNHRAILHNFVVVSDVGVLNTRQIKDPRYRRFILHNFVVPNVGVLYTR